MIRRKKVISGIALSGLLAIAILMQGCATPIEIKQASKAQIELINAVDEAVVNLQSSFDQFHRQKKSRIIEEGRMLIAQQAISVAMSGTNTSRCGTVFKEDAIALPGTATVTPDCLFIKYGNDIQPWVDYAFEDVEHQIKIREEKKNATKNEVLKKALNKEINDFKILKGKFDNKPDDIKQIEAIIKEDITLEEKTANTTHENLDVLRGQMALVKVMHGKVDAWLAIDITPTQKQVDSLSTTITNAIQKKEGGNK